MAKVLELTFETEAGKKTTLTVDEPRTDLSSGDVQGAMEQIIASGAFEIEASPLAVMKSARIVERNVTDFVMS